MRHRDLLSIRAHREEIEAQERAERERIEAPIRAAESALKETSRAVAMAIRERIVSGKDDEFKIDPATFTPIPKHISASDYNKAQARLFREANPDYFACQENLDALVNYITGNAPNIVLVSALQLEWAFKRLRAYGLISERPEPEPELESELEPEPEPAKPIEPELIDGWDLESGEPRKWTPRELDRLSSKDYRKALRLYKSDLELPTVGPGTRLPA